MTSERQKNAGRLLPSVIEPHPLICVTMKIPDVPEYRVAFVGAIEELGKYWNWEKWVGPESSRAKQAATYWQELIYQFLKFNDCGDLPMLRQSPVDPCILEQSFDGGETWSTAFNFALCQPSGSSPFQLQSMVNGTQALQNSILDRFDGTDPTSINANAPATLGDTDPLREAALCMALKSFIVSVLQDWEYRLELGQFLVGAGAVLSILLFPYGMIAATSVAVGLTVAAEELLAAIHDASAINDLICCVKDQMMANNNALTKENFAGDFVGCEGTGNQALIYSQVSQAALQVGNFAVFVDALGRFQQFAENGVEDCPTCDCPPSRVWNWLDGTTTDLDGWEAITTHSFPIGQPYTAPNMTDYSFDLSGTPPALQIVGGGYSNGSTPFVQTGGEVDIDDEDCLLTQVAVTWRQNAISTHSSGCHVWVYRAGLWQWVAQTEGVQNTFIKRFVNINLSGCSKIAIVPVSEKPNLVAGVEIYFG